MTITDINRKFTEIVSDYIRRGFTINIGTMGGSQGEEGHVDLTNGEIVIRVLLDRFVDYGELGLDGYEIVVGTATDAVKPNEYGHVVIWNNRLYVIEHHKFYFVSNSSYGTYGKKFFGDEAAAKAAAEKRFERCSGKHEVNERKRFTGKAIRIAESVVKRHMGIKNVSKDKLEVYKTCEGGKNKYFVKYRSNLITLK